MQTTPGASRVNHIGAISMSRVVFSLPELAGTICGFCTSLDQVRLLQTSKALFKASIRFVWEHVDGVNNLLLLITGASQTLGRHPELVLPSTAGANIFQRFDVYSPYVKHLDVYAAKEPAFLLIHWKPLFLRADKQPLLPALHTIAIGTAPDDGELDLVGWLRAFATNSLTSLAMAPKHLDSPLFMTYDASAYMVKLLATKCPRLKKIGLYPSDRHTSLELHNNPVLADVAPERFEHYLAGLSNLEHVSGSMNLLGSEYIYALGRLPALVTLSVYGDLDDKVDICPEVDLDLFPSLKSVLLYNKYLFEIIPFMETEAITKNLTSLHLQFQVGELDNEQEDRVKLKEELFPLLLNAPKLVELKIDPDLDEYCDIDLDAAALDILAKLPLRIIKFTRLRIIDACLDSSLGAHFPSVTSFVMPDQHVDLRELSWFAALPRIQSLQLALVLDLVVTPRPEEWDWPTPDESEVTVLEASHSSYVPSCFEELDLTVRGLLSMFPNLTRVDWAEPKPSAPREERRQDQIQTFNGYLAAQAKIRALERTSKTKAL